MAGCKKVHRIEVCLVDTEFCLDEPLRSPESVANACRTLQVCTRPIEEIYVFAIGTRGHLIGYTPVSKGGVNGAAVLPGDVLRPLLGHGAATFVLVHNHPSGDPTPSEEDKLLTMRLIEAGRIMGIKMVDHVILGHDSYFSFQEAGMM